MHLIIFFLINYTLLVGNYEQCIYGYVYHLPIY